MILASEPNRSPGTRRRTNDMSLPKSLLARLVRGLVVVTRRMGSRIESVKPDRGRGDETLNTPLTWASHRRGDRRTAGSLPGLVSWSLCWTWSVRNPWAGQQPGQRHGTTCSYFVVRAGQRETKIPSGEWGTTDQPLDCQSAFSLEWAQPVSGPPRACSWVNTMVSYSGGSTLRLPATADGCPCPP
jgi:hypothetical protein